MAEKEEFAQLTVLLPYSSFLTLVNEALIRLGPEDKSSLDYQVLHTLQHIPAPGSAHSLLAAHQSSVFRAVFKSYYPEAESFTTIEHCLWHAESSQTEWLLAATTETVPELAQHYLRMIRQKAQNPASLQSIITLLKDKLCSALPEDIGVINESNQQEFVEPLAINDNPDTQFKTTDLTDAVAHHNQHKRKGFVFFNEEQPVKKVKHEHSTTHNRYK